jgi:hypothetical protein
LADEEEAGGGASTGGFAGTGVAAFFTGAGARLKGMRRTGACATGDGISASFGGGGGSTSATGGATGSAGAGVSVTTDAGVLGTAEAVAAAPEVAAPLGSGLRSVRKAKATPPTSTHAPTATSGRRRLRRAEG